MGRLTAPSPAPRGTLSTRLWPIVLAATVVACGLWIAHRAVAVDRFFTGNHNPYVLLFTFVCALFIWQVFLAWRQGRGFSVPAARQPELDRLTVCVNVPCYNEDPELLHRALGAIFAQTRPAARVEVIDDGSTVDYSAVRDYWRTNRPDDIVFVWRRTENHGKRHAQAEIRVPKAR